MVRRAILGLLAAWFLLAGSLPCPPAEARGRTFSVAADFASAPVHGHAGGSPMHHAGGAAPCPQEAPRHALAPPCPCRCGEREPGSPATPLGHALASKAPSLPAADAHPAAPREPNRLPDAAPRPIEHVPLHT